ncbi:MAG: dihydropteroate synthase [Actinophytocola sp.]|nr:dihydropteroate synthase [Actinophytocola sp.]
MRMARDAAHRARRLSWETAGWRDDRVPRLMGILNINADSFSDPREATCVRSDVTWLIRQGARLWQAGADAVDVGAESASPATPVVDARAEIDALLPVLDGLHSSGVTTSVDTYKPTVARACVAAGVAVINDYSGLAHPEVAGICAEGGARLVLTHNPTGVKKKVLDPRAYTDIMDEMAAWFEAKLAVIAAHGLAPEHVLLDPGIDLAKTPAQSIDVFRGLNALTRYELPLLVAISRKDFIGAVSRSDPADRDPGTLAALAHLIGLPRVIARVHDVAAARQFLDVADILADRTPVARTLTLPRTLRRAKAASDTAG